MSLLRSRSHQTPSQLLDNRLRKFTETALDEATVLEGAVLGRGSGDTPLLSRLQLSRQAGVDRAFRSLLSTKTSSAMPAGADPPPDAPAERPARVQQVQWLPLAAIQSRPDAGRTVTCPDRLEQLVASIRAVGIIEPLIVRPAEAATTTTRPQYILVAGERRRLAAEQVGLLYVPAIIKTVGAIQALEQMLLAELHHVPLPPLDQARGYRQLLATGLSSVAELAERCGVSPAEIEGALGLLDLEDDIARSLAEGRLTRDQALELVQIEDGSSRRRLWRRALRYGWSPERMRVARADWAKPLSTVQGITKLDQVR